MPTKSHHVCCVTDDPHAVVAFLREVIGLPVQLEFDVLGPSATAILSWPEGNPGGRGWMLGDGAAGLVEVIGIPTELKGQVQPGIALASFSTRDLEAQIEACKTAGIDVSELSHSKTDNVDLSGVFVEVGGVRFELVRFNA